MKYNKDYTKILDKLIINIETFFIFEASWHKIPNSEYSTWIGNTQEKNDVLSIYPAKCWKTLNKDATLFEGDELPPVTLPRQMLAWDHF